MKKFNSKLHSVFAVEGQPIAELQSVAESRFNTQELLYVDIEQLYSGKYQPRKHFAQELLAEMAASIKAQGILQPIIVRAGHRDHRYEIIAGERRWRAAQLAQLKQVPILVSLIKNADAVAFGLLENIQREDLNAIEEADAYKRLIDEFTLSHNEISARVGKSRSAISNSLRLLELPISIRAMLVAGSISVGHAKVLLSLDQNNKTLVEQIAHKIIAGNMTVRQLERYIKQIAMPQEQYDNDVDKKNNLEELNEIERQFTDLTGLQSKVVFNHKGGGVVTLCFARKEQLNDILKCLHSTHKSYK